MAIFKAQKEKLMLDGPENLNRLVIGAEIKGDLTTQTSIRLDGIIVGKVTCGGKLVLGPKAKVIGNVYSINAEIEGQIEGDITIHEKLVLRSTSIVKGNIITQKILIEDGAEFNGSCEMSVEGVAKSEDKKTTDSSSKKDVSEDMVY